MAAPPLRRRGTRTGSCQGPRDPGAGGSARSSCSLRLPAVLAGRREGQMLGLAGPGARGQQLKGGTMRGCSGRRPAVLHVAGKGWKGREVVEKNRGSRPPASVAALRQSPIFLLSLNRAIDFCNALIFYF